MRHSVLISGVNTSNIKVLSNEEMQELFKKLHEGDTLAREKLINGNLKLVLSIVQRFSTKTDNLDDLFQIGCVGLIKAIDNFDLSFNVKFSTYSVPMILGEVKRFLRDNSQLRVSRGIKDIAYKAIKIKDEARKNGIDITDEEIAKKLDVSLFDLVNALSSLKDPVSMFEPIYSDGGDTIYLYDQLEDNKSKQDLDMKLAINNAFKKLKSREQGVILDRFILGKTQTEISNELGISQAQVSRIEKIALDKMKKTIE